MATTDAPPATASAPAEASSSSSSPGCHCSDGRGTSVRGDDEADLPRSILLSFGEDDLGCIASFLGPQDFANLAATCKQFGLNLHKIGAEPVSLWRMMAYKFYRGATEREKEALPVYTHGRSSYFYYNELLKLRRPLRFDRLLGWGIDHAMGNKSQIAASKRTVAVKPPEGRFFLAYTAVSNYAMRSGKHYVTFKCAAGGAGVPHGLLWLGIVRPLQMLDARHRPVFTPFCTRFVDELRELQTAEWGESDVHCCVFTAESGQCQWTDWDFGDDPADYPEDDESIDDELHSEDWQGMESFEGGTIGMILDHDAGTLSVFKNGVQLGVMKEGLSGSYCWMVTVQGSWISSSSDGITIARGHPLDTVGDEPCMHPPKRKQPRLLQAKKR